jgi:uncharacterized protein YeaO (DUF488 family)
MFQMKRIYEPAEPEDGFRVLVERLWPRGVRKENARLDAWARDIAPSMELRRWYGHQAEKWPEFQTCYREELESPPAQAALADLADKGRRGNVTLLFSTRDGRHSNAEVLLEILTEMARAGTW